MPPETKTPPKDILGFTGIRRYGGLITEEYVSELSGSRAIDTYTRMRSDGMIEAALRAAELALQAAAWSIGPVDGTPKAKEIADFVSGVLFESLAPNWDHQIENACAMLQYGFAAQIKEWATSEDRWIIEELRSVHPKAIMDGVRRWDFDANGRLQGFWEYGSDGQRFRELYIPKERAILFTLAGRFGNPEGRSLLRGPYKHWLMKDTFYRIQAIGLERGAVGTMMGTYPAGTPLDKQQDFQDLLEKLIAYENAAFTVGGDGFKVENISVDVKTSDLMAAIQHHNAQIAMAFLAQFLNLGQEGRGGAYALSQDQSDLFLKALGGYGDYIAARYNRDLIPELVWYNYGAQARYPKMTCVVGERSVNGLAAALKMLATGPGAPVTWSEADEDWLREIMKLPERAIPRPGAPIGEPAPIRSNPAGSTDTDTVEPDEMARRQAFALPVVETEPASYGAEVGFPELMDLIAEFNRTLGKLTRTLGDELFQITGLPREVEASRAGFQQVQVFAEEKFRLTQAQWALVDDAIEQFLVTYAGQDRTLQGFIGTESEDALLQSFLRLGHAVGQNEVRKITGAAPAGGITRDSPMMRHMLTRSFERLTQKGAKEIGSQILDVQKILTDAQQAGWNPFYVSKKLDTELMAVENWKWERLARTELAAASTEGQVNEYRLEGIPKLEVIVAKLACPECQEHEGVILPVETAAWGETIPPFHPNCLCYTAPVTEEE